MRWKVALWVAVSVLGSSQQGHAEGATFRSRVPAALSAINGGDGYLGDTNENGVLGWGESYLMMSRVALYRTTHDPALLVALAREVQGMLDATDAARGVKDFLGRSRECWQATKYSGAGKEPYCWAVHSGMLLAPMIEFVGLVAEHPEHAELSVEGLGTVQSIADAAKPKLIEAVDVFDADLVSGPGSGEMHYIAEAKATFTSFAGGPLPLNMMNALGRAELALWQLTGDTKYRDRAEGLSRYLKNRMSKNGTAYAWTYSGQAWSSGKGEDISHAAINVDFAVKSFEAGLVFDASDMTRLCRTLLDHVHVDTNTAKDLVDGGGGTNTYQMQLGAWLGLVPYCPGAWPTAANLYRDVTKGSASVVYGLASLATTAPAVTGHGFYVADWSDKGDYQKATAFGANLVYPAPDSTKSSVMAVRYRAWKATQVEQWDGAAYHFQQTLAPASAESLAYVPFDPKLFFAYYKGQALYQFTDSFVASEGIEVWKSAATEAPAITTTSLPEPTSAGAYQTTLTATGDAPLLWSLPKSPAGVTIDEQSGEVTVESLAAPVEISARVDNDVGHAERSYTLSFGTAGSGWGGGAGISGVGGSAGASTGGSASAKPTEDDGGCGCRTQRAPSGAGAWLVLGLLGLARRRRL
ncbi:MAG: hypothetical protein KC776_00655 [Myxococcales bacterium]|nr:hypothetical protein [Myxococcales bacterium]MCB9581305.1 hypothetical protein [Polyangiaceae bacterium]